MATDIFSVNTLLVLNLFMVPLLIAGITLAARRWGPAVGGLLSAFPVISAPILFLGLQEIEWVILVILDRWEHAGENL